MKEARFAAQWLMLREAADEMARDRDLMRRFAASLPRAPRIIDLGAGTGAMARALMPLIGREQHWRLAECDPSHIAAQAVAMRDWASRRGFDMAAWHALPHLFDARGGMQTLDAEAIDGVTASAFFDLAGSTWIERFATWLASRRLPLLATLMVDGRRNYRPADPDDGALDGAFRRHQARDKGLGPALGPAAARALQGALASRGYRVFAAASDWRLGAAHRDLLRTLVSGEAAAAREAGAAADGWESRRLAAIDQGGLVAAIGHCDLLALPPGICQNHP